MIYDMIYLLTAIG